jgi:hypothetical protein
MLKKIIASLLAISVCAVITSCNSKENSTAEKKDTSSATESSEPDNTDDAADEAESTETSSVQVSYDFDGIASEKAVKMLTSDKYHLKFSTDVSGQPMSQEIYYLNGGILVNVEFMNTVYTNIYTDKTQYTIIDDIYYKLPVEDAETDSVDMFEDYGYVSSGETELDGKTYKYDEFYQGTTGTYSKFIMDGDMLYAIQNNDNTVMKIETLDDSFDDSAVSVPAGAKEVSQDEFNTLFLQKVAGVTTE